MMNNNSTTTILVGDHVHVTAAHPDEGIDPAAVGIVIALDLTTGPHAAAVAFGTGRVFWTPLTSLEQTIGAQTSRRGEGRERSVRCQGLHDRCAPVHTWNRSGYCDRCVTGEHGAF